MKLEINIADDRELRNFIKDSIKGEVTAIARGEIKGIIADVVREGVIPSDKSDLERIVRNIIADEVKSQLKQSYFDGSDVIKKIAREEIVKLLQEALQKKQLV